MEELGSMSAFAPAGATVAPELLTRYGCGPIAFSGTENAIYERHLLFDKAIDPPAASARDKFEAFARSVRDICSME